MVANIVYVRCDSEVYLVPWTEEERDEISACGHSVIALGDCRQRTWTNLRHPEFLDLGTNFNLILLPHKSNSLR